MANRKSQQEAAAEIFNAWGGTIEMIGLYQTYNEPVLCKCNICGREFSPRFHRIKTKETGCPGCKLKETGIKLRKDPLAYKAEFEAKYNGRFKLISEYKTAIDPISIECLECGLIFERIAKDVKYSLKCPTCNRSINNNKRLTEYQLRNRIEEIGKGEYILLSEYLDYQNEKSPITLKHCCGESYNTTLQKFTQKGDYGNCPKCYHKHSKGEIKIQKILEDNNIRFKSEVSFDNLRSEKNRKLRFDFGLYDDNDELIKLIEFDGIQHQVRWEQFTSEREFELLKVRDWLKTNYCIANDIPLLRINYDQLDNITLEQLLNEETYKGYKSSIIGMDIATTSGFSIWQDGVLSDYFLKKLSEHKDARILEFSNVIEEIILENYPSMVIIEDILDIGTKEELGKSFNTFKLLAMYHGVVLMMLYKYQIPYEIITSSAWKKQFGVVGTYRKDQKASCMKIVNESIVVDSEDVCDAIGIGYYYVSGGFNKDKKNPPTKAEDIEWM